MQHSCDREDNQRRDDRGNGDDDRARPPSSKKPWRLQRCDRVGERCRPWRPESRTSDEQQLVAKSIRDGRAALAHGHPGDHGARGPAKGRHVLDCTIARRPAGTAFARRVPGRTGQTRYVAVDAGCVPSAPGARFEPEQDDVVERLALRQLVRSRRPAKAGAVAGSMTPLEVGVAITQIVRASAAVVAAVVPSIERNRRARNRGSATVELGTGPRRGAWRCTEPRGARPSSRRPASGHGRSRGPRCTRSPHASRAFRDSRSRPSHRARKQRQRPPAAITNKNGPRDPHQA